MKSTLRSLAKEVLPPAVARLYSASRRKFGFTGDYPSWDAAMKASSGYAAESILQKVLVSARKVKQGKAAFERDSVAFERPDHNWPLLTHLLWVASCNEARLHVADFGGSLGSTYFQYQSYLAGLKELTWTVIEQAAFVNAGRNEFLDDRLSFEERFEVAVAKRPPNVLLLSSVLPYIEDPYALLAGLLAFRVPYIIIDRTPFIDLGRDRLTVQKVSSSIYEASYPAWFLHRSKFMETMEKDYRLFAEFDGFDDANIDCAYRGFVYERKH